MSGNFRTLAVAAFLTAYLTGAGLDPFQTLYRLNRQGNQAVENQEPKTAIEKYSKALEMAPKDPRLLFNLAGAQAQAGQLEEARRNWERAAELGDRQLKRDSLYNRGVADLASRQFGPAVGDFARALNIDPADKEARRNLELALRQLQMQQQQQNQQKEGDSSQDQKQQQHNQSSPDSKPDQPQHGQDQQPSEQKDQDGSSAQAGDQQPEKAQNEERKMAERLLDSLQREETDALKRALRRRQTKEQPREKDW